MSESKKKAIKIEIEVKAITFEDGKGCKNFYKEDDVIYRSIEDKGEIANKIAMSRLPTEVLKEIRAAFIYVDLVNLEKDYLKRVIKDLEFEDSAVKIEMEKKLSFLNGLFPE